MIAYVGSYYLLSRRGYTEADRYGFVGFYYLELRTARGFDSTIRTTPTVLVHVAEDFHSRMDRGRHTWLLDMEPASKTIEGLVAESLTALADAPITEDARTALGELGNYVAWRDR